MSIVIAKNKHNLFGYDGDLAFKSKTDLNIFSRLTRTFGNVVMGRKTWVSLPDNMKPLPNEQYGMSNRYVNE